MSMQELVTKLEKLEKFQQEVTFFPQSQQADFQVSNTEIAKDAGLIAVVAIIAFLGYSALKGFSGWNPFGNLQNDLGKLIGSAAVSALSAPEKALTAATNQGVIAAANTQLGYMNSINASQDIISKIPAGQPGSNPALANWYKKSGTVTQPQYGIYNEDAYLKWNAASGGGPTVSTYANNLVRSISQAALVQQQANAFNPASLGGLNVLGTAITGAYNVVTLQRANAQLDALNNIQVTPAEKAMGWASAPKYSITDPNAFLKWLGA